MNKKLKDYPFVFQVINEIISNYTHNEGKVPNEIEKVKDEVLNSEPTGNLVEILQSGSVDKGQMTKNLRILFFKKVSVKRKLKDFPIVLQIMKDLLVECLPITDAIAKKTGRNDGKALDAAEKTKDYVLNMEPRDNIKKILESEPIEKEQLREDLEKLYIGSFNRFKIKDEDIESPIIDPTIVKGKYKEDPTKIREKIKNLIESNSFDSEQITKYMKKLKEWEERNKIKIEGPVLLTKDQNIEIDTKVPLGDEYIFNLLKSIVGKEDALRILKLSDKKKEIYYKKFLIGKAGLTDIEFTYYLFKIQEVILEEETPKKRKSKFTVKGRTDSEFSDNTGIPNYTITRSKRTMYEKIASCKYRNSNF